VDLAESPSVQEGQVGVVGIGRIASAWIPAAAYWDAPLAMTYTTILGGMLREVQPHAIILAAGTRIALPPDLSAKDVPVGSSVLVTVTPSERGEWIARQIEHEPRRNGQGR
jgi:hypothetical protein